MKDKYIIALKERLKDKKAILKEYSLKIRELKNQNKDFTLRAYTEEVLRLERAIYEINKCLELYNEVKGGLRQ